MANLNWHLDGIENCLGKETLGMSVRDYLVKLIEVGRLTQCNWHHSSG